MGLCRLLASRECGACEHFFSTLESLSTRRPPPAEFRVASATSMKKFMKELGFLGLLQVPNAKRNLGCEELKRAIPAGINWDELPCRTTEALFKRLKEEIIRLKDEGRVLMRFNELCVTLQLRLCGARVSPAAPRAREERREAGSRRDACSTEPLHRRGTARGADAAGRSWRGVGAGVRQLGAAPAGAHQRLRAGRDPDVAGGRASARLPDGQAGLEGRPGV